MVEKCNFQGCEIEERVRDNEITLAEITTKLDILIKRRPIEMLFLGLIVGGFSGLIGYLVK